MSPHRVVWVTALAPDHDGTGGQLRQAHLLDTVAATHETHLVVAGPGTGDAVRDRVAEVVEVPSRPPSPGGGRLAGRLRLARHLVFAHHPWHVDHARGQRRALAAALRERLRPDDAVVVEHLELAPLAAAHPPGRWLLTVHHARSRQARHQAGLASTRRRRWYWQVQARRAARLEGWSLQVYDRVLAVSAVDARAIGAGCRVVPNGVDLARFRPAPLPSEPRLVFVGNLDYGPNVDGVEWLCREVWPAIRRTWPEARLDIVGRRPDAAVRRATRGPGLRLHADVPSIAGYLRDARVVLVPLRLGGGTRLKALQGLAAGRPVVGTTIGLEGLAVRDEEHVLVADDPAAYAAAVNRALSDDALAARLGAAGRGLVERCYGWPAVGRRLLAELGPERPRPD